MLPCSGRRKDVGDRASPRWNAPRHTASKASAVRRSARFGAPAGPEGVAPTASLNEIMPCHLLAAANSVGDCARDFSPGSGFQRAGWAREMLLPQNGRKRKLTEGVGLSRVFMLRNPSVSGWARAAREVQLNESAKPCVGRWCTRTRRRLKAAGRLYLQKHSRLGDFALLCY